MAGDPAPVAPPPMEVVDLKPVCDAFDTGSTSVDLFGVYVFADGSDMIDDSAGGGLALTHFHNSYIGFSTGIYWWDDGDAVVHSVTGSMILRYPIRSLCIAPYVVGGIGGHFDSVNQFTGHIGGGLEIRCPSLNCVGFFVEGTYNFADKSDNYTVLRVGTRIDL